MPVQYKQRQGSIDEKTAQVLSAEGNISPITAQVLAQRGITSFDELQQFMEPRYAYLCDPFLLPDMEAAVKRIQRAMDDGVSICVYGDYDVDGVCAVVILLTFLRKRGANVQYYIPNRHHEGYGLNCEAIQQIHAQGVGLIITVDCGISNHSEVELTNRLGMDVIITDHHQCPQELPACIAIVNPKRQDANRCYQDYCGAGVALRLVEAMGSQAEAQEYVDLAALATVADIVPLLGDNRVIVAEGLGKIANQPCAGILALINAVGIGDKQITSGHLGFYLAPRVNAAGRLYSVNQCVEMFTAPSFSEAMRIAQELEQHNQERRSITESVVAQALARIPEDISWIKDEGIVLWDEGWETGILGIVASKIAEQYNRPTVLLGRENGMFHGSGRSIPGVNLFEMLAECQDLFVRFGGHAQAVGLSIEESRLVDFKIRFQKVLKARVKEETYVPIGLYDQRIRAEDIALKVVSELERLAPFGCGNPSPVFFLEDVSLSRIRAIGSQGQHFNGEARIDESVSLPVVAFGMEAPIENPLKRYDLLATLQNNEWKGKKSLQGVVQRYSQRPVPWSYWLENNYAEDEFVASFWMQALLEPPQENETRFLNIADTATALDEALEQLFASPFGNMVVAHTLPGMRSVLQNSYVRSHWKDIQVVMGRGAEGLLPETVLVLAPRWGELSAESYRRVLVVDKLWNPFVLPALAEKAPGTHFQGIDLRPNAEIDEVWREMPFSQQGLRLLYRRLREGIALGVCGNDTASGAVWLSTCSKTPLWICELGIAIFCQLGILGHNMKIPQPCPQVDLMQSAIYARICSMGVHDKIPQTMRK